MKNLKKFQEFALTQEEQKNVSGGLIGASFKCYANNGADATFGMTGGGAACQNFLNNNGGGTCTQVN